MAAVVRWAVADLRHRRTAAIGLGLLVAVAVVVPLTTATAARRTASALDRMQAELKPYHADVQFESEEPPPTDALERIRALPGVEAAGTGAVLFARPAGTVREFTEAFGQGGLTPEVGTEIDRIRLEVGRLPSRPDEVLLSTHVAGEIRRGVGDRIELETLTWDGIFAAWDGESVAFDGPRIPLEVVGVGDAPEAITGADMVNAPSFVVAGTFFDAWRDDVAFFEGIHLVRLEGGAAAGADFEQAVQAAFPGRSDVAVNVTQQDDRVSGAIDAQTVALALLTAASSVAAAVAIGQAVSRHVRQSAADERVLDALGLPRRHRLLARLGSVAVPVLAGVLLAAVGAVAASRWFPTGTAGRIEPSPGTRIDTVVMLAGLFATAGVGIVGAVIGRRGSLPVRRSRALESAAVASLPVPVSMGLRSALHRGPATGVPVRAPFLAAVAGVVGVVGALVFAASMERLVDTPPRYGVSFDAAIAVGDELSDEEALTAAKVVADERWVESALLARVNNVIIERREIFAFGLRPVSGALGLTVVDGRGVEGDGEVVLGGRTMDRLGVEIGDTVAAAGVDGSEVSLRVVGQALFPTIENEDPASGAGLTLSTYDRLEEIDQGFPDLYVDLVDGVSVEEVAEDLEEHGAVTAGSHPAVIGNLDGVSSIPYVLGAFLASLAAVAVGHAIVTTVRVRRHELAVLKAFGSSRRGLATTVVVQALVFGVVGLGAGVPLGLALGARAWRGVASALGMAGDAVVPASVWGVVPVAITSVLVVAAGPARSASQTNPARALRGE